MDVSSLMPPAAAQLLLLDLPVELVQEVLSSAPLALRSTCRQFRALLDGGRRSLRLLPQPHLFLHLRLHHLTALLQRLPLLTDLNCGPCDFKSLPFLAACPALRSLTLLGSSLFTDRLSMLTACLQLTALRFTGPFQAGPSGLPLAAPPLLRSLCFCGGTNFSSAAPLATVLPQLTALDLGSCRHMADFSLLATSAAHLASLEINASWLLSDLGPLSGCTRLTTLRLDYCFSLCELDPLAHLGLSLTHLSLRYRSLASAAPLSACTLLTHLDLTGGAVGDAMPLGACTRLVTLRVANSCIAQVQLDALALLLGPGVVDKEYSMATW